MKELTVGLDFGTSNTVISYFNKNPIIFKDSIKDLIPTKVYIGDTIQCGNYIPINLSSDLDKNIISNFKTQINLKHTYFINNRTYSVIDIVTIFFKHIKTLLENKFPDTHFNVVLTVPSNFDDNIRKILQNIAISLNFKVLRIINEPTAAAFAYGMQNLIEDEKIMVFDMGGGTLDISILEIDNNFFETKESVGINNLGGNSFTQIIYNDCLKEFKEKNNINTIFIKQSKLTQLMYNCNKAKEKLSWVDSCIIKVKNFYTLTNNVSIDLEYNLDLIKFKTISNLLIDKIIKKIEPLQKKYDISKIILVGGSSKLKIVHDLLKEQFKIDPSIHKNLQQVVSIGACYYGAMIRKELNNNEIILVDNLPLSLGIEMADGTFSIIIPKNTPLPAKKSQEYTLDTIGENIVNIKVYQGERDIANKNYLIGNFEFDKISKVGIPILTITFKVDINGLININVKDKHSGNSKDIYVRNIDENILTNIDKILQEADHFKENDMNEMLQNQLYYKIETKIETILLNIKNNNLIATSKKEEITKILIDKMDNMQNKIIPDLIKIDNNLDEEYIVLMNSNSIDSNDINSSSMNIEDIIIQEKIEFLRNKIDFYMSKDISEFQNECIISISNFIETKDLNQKDIDEKLEYIKNIFCDNYKDELLQLCLFLKTEIENKNLDISSEQYNILSKKVSEYILLLDSNNINIDYKEEIDNLNNICKKFITH